MKIELEQADIDKISSEITRRVLEEFRSSIVTIVPPEDTILTVKTLAEYLNDDT